MWWKRFHAKTPEFFGKHRPLLFVVFLGLLTATAIAKAPASRSVSSESISGQSRAALLPTRAATPPQRFFAEMQTSSEAAVGSTQDSSAASANEPFPFSHKRHAEMRLECSYCHEQAQTGTRAGFPRAANCMKCHMQIAKDSEQIKKLAALSANSHIIPEKPLYKLPDFVMFSHARHKTAGIECAACHGNVLEFDVVELHFPMRMKACVDCHKANHAAVTCTTCHEAFQQ